MEEPRWQYISRVNCRMTSAQDFRATMAAASVLLPHVPPGGTIVWHERKERKKRRMNLSEGAFCFRFATEGPIEGNPSFHHQKHATCSSGKRPDYRRFTQFLLFFFFFFCFFLLSPFIHPCSTDRETQREERNKVSRKRGQAPRLRERRGQ
ncbi:hypothetical protein LZ32DRAFT_129805 [Colletotrichum eremochloae]|nr:hypothetical protein LZ32DRAFT_129805 [Colletotrichum eremochloae]